MRGDGPAVVGATATVAEFSPRAWGWSGSPLSGRSKRVVLPTCVGMVRTRRSSPTVTRCSPHVRGDGPVLAQEFNCDWMFSPRAWGWSVYTRCVSVSSDVLPTCVGMVRKRSRRQAEWLRSPHVRGDGPHFESATTRAIEFSPRAWGWSGPPGRRGATADVLPTCVGMVRAGSRSTAAWRRSPHVRGDGPRFGYTFVLVKRFSPRAWGWSALQGRPLRHLPVLPTCVGMVPGPPHQNGGFS